MVAQARNQGLDSVPDARKMLGLTQKKGVGIKGGDGMDVVSRKTSAPAKRPEPAKRTGSKETGLSVVNDVSNSPRVDINVEDTVKSEKKEKKEEEKKEAKKEQEKREEEGLELLDKLADSFNEGVQTTGGLSVEEPAVDEAPEMPPTPKTDKTGLDVVKSAIEEPAELEETLRKADSTGGVDVDGEVLALTPAPAPVSRPSGPEPQFMAKQASSSSNIFAVLTIMAIFAFMLYISRAEHSDTFFHESSRVAKVMSEKVVIKVRDQFRKKNTLLRSGQRQQRTYG